MRYLLVVLGGLLALAPSPARAQSGEGGYAAPGFPMSFSRRPPPPPALKREEIVSPLLTRFWHDEVAGKQRASDFYRYMSTYLKYPTAAAKAGMVGHIFVRLTVGPNGRVSDARIVRSRTVSMLAAQPDATALSAATTALEAETLRIFRAAHFLVSKEKADTVTVSASFQLE